jgi:hypothetical protein
MGDGEVSVVRTEHSKEGRDFENVTYKALRFLHEVH